MKAVRLTTAFAVVFGVVLPLPDGRDVIPAGWAAEKDAPDNGASRQRAEDLAKSASDRFGEIVGGKEAQPKAAPLADTMQPGGPTVGLVEQIHGWTARSSAHYQELMRGLSRAPQYNPVADAAARVAARPEQQGASGEQGPQAQSYIETVIGWVHQAGVQYQTVVRGLLSEPGQTVVAAKGPETEAKGKQAEDARRLAEVLKAAEATKVDEARIATAKQAEAQKTAGAKTSDGAQVAAAKQAEDARRAEDERRAAEAQKAAEAKKAEEARVAAAKEAEDTRRVEEARRVAEAQKAAEAKKAEEARVAAAKQAEDVRRADEARRAAEAQKAADAKKAEEARVAAAKQAEETRRAEEARRVAEAQKAAEEARIAAAKQAEDSRRAEESRRVAEAQKSEEARIAAAKQAEDARRAEEARRVAETQKAAAAKRGKEPRRVAGGKSAETNTPQTAQAGATPPRKRTAEERRTERKERAARKGAASRKVAVAGSRQRAKSVATGKGRRKGAEHACRMAGNRTNVPGWYVVKRGDTLWKIAARHYGKGQRYPVIYRANTRRIADPNLIVRCQRIYLPKFRRRG
jgi:hypothetical protein